MRVVRQFFRAEDAPRYRVPKGTPIRTTHPKRGPVTVAKRTYTVRAFSVFYDEVTWVGSGCYWFHASTADLIQEPPESAA